MPLKTAVVHQRREYDIDFRSSHAKRNPNWVPGTPDMFKNASELTNHEIRATNCTTSPKLTTNTDLAVITFLPLKIFWAAWLEPSHSTMFRLETYRTSADSVGPISRYEPKR